MANAVDERIVAAKFDSSDFEKGVDKTIKKLDELEEKLDMKDVGKGLEESSKKTQKATESLSKSMENLENRFTSFMGLIKQKTLESLADAVVNSFWKMEKATLGFFRSMTTGQVSAGMDKYESMLTSVRMITNSTYFANDADKKAGKKTYYKQEDAYASMEKLQKYADETSYSMEQMTDAMSKMVAAGVSLKQAERNVQGIASACANAGVNATDASRAFFNLSQAYSTGALKYTDYRSLELLNLTNEAFQDQLLAAGVAAGVLEEKTDKNGNKSYKTKKTDRNGKVTAGKKFTRQGLGESLKYNWADKDVMDALFGGQYYVDVADFEDAKEDPVTKRQRTTEERIEYLSKLVDESKMAAKATDKEVEEVLKNLDEKDSRKTEYASLKTEKERKAYLKKMREEEDVQAKLIDKETEKIVESLDDTDKRKQDLATITDPEERSKRLAELRQEDDIMAKLPKKYSEVAIKAFMAAREARNFNDVIKAVADFVSSKFSKVFEILFGKLDEAAEFFTALSEGGIAGIFTGFAEYLENVFKEFDSNGGGMGGKAFRDLLLEIDSAVGMLSDTFGAFMPSAKSLGDWLYEFTADLSVDVQMLKIYIEQFQGWLSETDGQATRLQKIQNILGNVFGVFGAVGKAIEVAIDAIRKGLDLLTPVFDLVINFVSELTKPIGQLGSRNYTAPFDKISNAINNIYQVLKPVSDLLGPFISKLGTILGQVGAFLLQGSIDTFVMNFEFIGDLIKFIVDLFGPDDMKAVMQGNDVLGDIVNTIDAFKKVCSDAFGAVKQFFGTLISDLRKFAGLEESGEGEGVFSGIKNFFDTNEFINNAKAWFEQAKKDIVAWFKGLPQKIGDFFNDLLYDKKLVSYMDKGNTKSKYVTVDSPLKQRIDAIIEATRTFLKELPGKIKAKATQFAKSFKNTIHGLFYTKVFDVDEKGNKKQVEIATPLKRWIDRVATGLINAIKTFILNIPEYIKTGIKAVGSAGRFIAEGIRGLFNHEDAEKALEDETNKITLSGVISALGDIAATLFNEIVSLFTNTDDMQKNFELVGQKILGFITSIPKMINDGVNGITFAFGNVWEWIYDKIVGSSPDGTDSKLMAFIEENFGDNASDDSIIGKIKNIPGLIHAAFTDASAMLGSMWSTLLGTQVGTKKVKVLDEKGIVGFEDVPITIEDKIDEIKLKITTFIKNLPKTIENTWKNVQSSVHEWWGKVLDIKVGENENGDVTVRDKLEQAKTDIENFIKDLPGNIKAAWEQAKEKFSEAWGKVLNMQIGTKKRQVVGVNEMGSPIFGDVPETVEDKINEIKKTIEDFIHNLPDFIREKWEDVKTSLAAAWKTIMSLPVGTKKEKVDVDETGKAIFAEVPITLEEAINTFITNLPYKLQHAVDEAKKSVGKFWTDLVAVFNGADDKENKNGGLRNTFVNILANIPTYLAEGLNAAISGIDWVFGKISEAFKNSTSLEKVADEAAVASEDTLANGLPNPDAPKNKFLAALSKLGQSLKTLIMETIPGAIVDGFNFVKNNWQSWATSLYNIFTGAGEGIDVSKFNASELIQKLKAFILSLPDRIKEAIDEAKSLISNLFNKKDESKWYTPITSFIAGIPKTIKKFPNAVQGFFDKTRDSFKSGDVVGLLDDVGEMFSESTEESNLWSDIVEIGKTIGDALMAGIGYVVENVGPIFLKMKTGIIDVISKLTTALSRWFGGEKLGDVLAEVFGIDPRFSGITDLLSSVGDTITEFVTTKFPKFLGGLIGFIVTNIGDFFKQIMAGFQEVVDKNDSGQSVAEIEELFTNSSNFLGMIIKTINDFIGSLADEGGITGAGVMWAIIGFVILAALLIGHIVNLFKGGGGTEAGAEKAEAKNGIGGVLRAFINMISLFVILAGVCSQLNEGQMKNVEKVLGLLEKILDKMVPILTLFVAIKGGTDLFSNINELIGNFKDASSAGSGSGSGGTGSSGGFFDKVKDGLSETVTGFMDNIKALSTAFTASAIADMTGTAISDILESFINDFVKLGSAIDLFVTKIEKTFGDIEKSLGTINNAIDFMNKVFELVTIVLKVSNRRSRVDIAINLLDSLAGSFSLLTGPFKEELHFGEFIGNINTLMEMTDEMDAFVLWMNGSSAFTEFKYALATLGSVLSFSDFAKFASVNTVDDEQIENAIGILKKLLGNEDVKKLLKDFSSGTLETKPEKVMQGMESLVLFGNGLSNLAAGVSGFTSDSTKNLKDFFKTISEIAEQDTTSYGGIGLTDNMSNSNTISMSKGLMLLAGGLKDFTDTVNEIEYEDEKMAKAMTILQKLVDISAILDNIGRGFIGKLFMKGTDLTDFSTQINTLGDGLQDFMSHLHPKKIEGEEDLYEWSMKYITPAMYALNEISNAASKLDNSSVSNLKTLIGENGNMGNTIRLFMENVMGLFIMVDESTNQAYMVTPNKEMYDTFETVMDGFYKMCEMISKLSGVGNVQQIIENLVGKLPPALGMKSIVTHPMARLAQGIVETFRAMEAALTGVYDEASGELVELKAIDIKKVEEFMGLVDRLFTIILELFTFSNKESSNVNYEILDRNSTHGIAVTTKVSFSAETMLETLTATLTMITEHCDEIFTLINTLAGYKDFENIAKARDVIGVIGDLGIALNLWGTDESFHAMGGTDVNYDQAFNHITSGLANLVAFSGDSKVMTDAVSNILSNFNIMFENKENVEKLETIGNTMASYIYAGLQAAFDSDEEYQLKITPVLEDEKLRSQMGTLFGLENPQDFNFGQGFSDAVHNAFFNSTESNGVTATAFDTKLNELGDKIDALGTHIDGIATEFNGAKLIVDREAFVMSIGPYVDAYLSNIGYLHINHNATGNITMSPG